MGKVTLDDWKSGTKNYYIFVNLQMKYLQFLRLFQCTFNQYNKGMDN
jgi:hypothetical protein